MKEKEYNVRVKALCDFVKQSDLEDLREDIRSRGCSNPSVYGAWCEKNMEKNLREDYERKTTFTSDLSIAEWYVPLEGKSAIADTLRNILENWRNDIVFFAEFIIVLKLKSWEHNARGNNKYSDMYAQLHYYVKHLFFDWFDEDHPKYEDAIQYYYDYVD